jgi:hypothetical protein
VPDSNGSHPSHNDAIRRSGKDAPQSDILAATVALF